MAARLQTEEEYERIAPRELTKLLDALDQLGEEIDPELASDVLTIEFPSGDRFIVNSHRAARQLWLAAGSGAWHFDFDPTSARWIASKSGDELWSLLDRLLAEKLGHLVKLEPVAHG